ncbi:hypothetical protein ACSBRS_009845 [Streptococcus suis]|uniref:Uncharacterized protein n=1 Tax=Streptococcus suis TaxID=1307 RepID=A0A3Q8BD97_STRSU|nr:hypothetical protein [Streptococcus suis]ASW50433.1 hypothetical protein A7J08_09180 [Streptococcus suis]KPA70940.1 hypothetical protein WQ51_08765 [Streptococcus suis]NQM46480.1 hypothetical protein [Streptococcus suis]HEL1780127.1 hypothetical protein [Streptococcus suis]HEM2810904.1 hypothetical protein [Streptococcus suis]
MLIVKCLIVLYLGLLPVSAWVYRKQMPKWLLALYACPVLLSLLGWQTSWGFLLGLALACGVRVLGGRLIFGENHLNHFLSHLAVSLVLALGLFMF